METPNPVVKRTKLSFAGWTVRQYADGMYDAEGPNGSVTIGVRSFGAALDEVRRLARERSTRAAIVDDTRGERPL